MSTEPVKLSLLITVGGSAGAFKPSTPAMPAGAAGGQRSRRDRGRPPAVCRGRARRRIQKTTEDSEDDGEEACADGENQGGDEQPDDRGSELAHVVHSGTQSSRRVRGSCSFLAHRTAYVVDGSLTVRWESSTPEVGLNLQLVPALLPLEQPVATKGARHRHSLRRARPRCHRGLRSGSGPSGGGHRYPRVRCAADTSAPAAVSTVSGPGRTVISSPTA